MSGLYSHTVHLNQVMCSKIKLFYLIKKILKQFFYNKCQKTLLYALFTQFYLPIPGRTERIFDGFLRLPAQNLVGLFRVGPHLDNVTCTTTCNAVVELPACALLESMNELQHRKSSTRSDVEHLNRFELFLLQNTTNGMNMCFGQINHVDVVTDARAIGRVVIVTKHTKLLTDAHSRLGNERHQVLRHTVWQLANQASGMGTDGVEIAQQY